MNMDTRNAKQLFLHAVNSSPYPLKQTLLQQLGAVGGNHSIQRLVSADQIIQSRKNPIRSRRNWGELSVVSVGGVPIEVYGANADQRNIIENTLSLLPAAHIRQIPRIVVGETVGPIGSGTIKEGGNSARRGAEAFHRLEITYYALEKKLSLIGDEKTPVCRTLLHEVGHWVDWNLTILPPRNSRKRELLEQWFASLKYGGMTQGPGERAAEAYWRYFIGGLPDEIKTIVASSPAFNNSSTKP
jgi:hypothetical protein